MARGKRKDKLSRSANNEVGVSADKPFVVWIAILALAVGPTSIRFASFGPSGLAALGWNLVAVLSIIAAAYLGLRQFKTINESDEYLGYVHIGLFFSLLVVAGVSGSSLTGHLRDEAEKQRDREIAKDTNEQVRSIAEKIVALKAPANDADRKAIEAFTRNLGELAGQLAEFKVRAIQSLAKNAKRAALPIRLRAGALPRPALPNGEVVAGGYAVFLGTRVAARSSSSATTITEGNTTIFGYAVTEKGLALTLNLFDSRGTLVLSVDSGSGKINEVSVDERSVAWPLQINSSRIVFRGTDGLTFCDVQFLNPTTVVLRGTLFTPRGKLLSIGDAEGLIVMFPSGDAHRYQDVYMSDGVSFLHFNVPSGE